jgi:hypothetical protein
VEWKHAIGIWWVKAMDFRVYPHPTKPQIVYSEMQGADAIWRFDTKEQQLKTIKPYPGKGDPKLRIQLECTFHHKQTSPRQIVCW